MAFAGSDTSDRGKEEKTRLIPNKGTAVQIVPQTPGVGSGTSPFREINGTCKGTPPPRHEEREPEQGRLL